MSPHMFQALRAVVVAVLAALGEILIRHVDQMNDEDG
jgi:hypothetical protein